MRKKLSYFLRTVKTEKKKFLKEIKSVLRFDAYFPQKWGKQSLFYVTKINLTDTHLQICTFVIFALLLAG